MRTALLSLLIILITSCGKNEDSAHKVFEQTMESNQEIMRNAKESGKLDLSKLIENFNKLENNHTIFRSVEKNEGLKQEILKTINKLKEMPNFDEPVENKITKIGQLCKECHNTYKE